MGTTTSTAQFAVAQAASADALIELYQLDTTNLTAIYGAVQSGDPAPEYPGTTGLGTSGAGSVYCWTPGTFNNPAGGTDASVYYNGVEYQPLPIEGSGFEWNGTGKLPQPTLKISNIGGYAAALVIEFDGCVGATVTRTRVFQRFLDGGSDADTEAFFEPDRFVINKKSHHDKNYIEFELRASFDVQGLKIPRRQVIRDTCTQTYRQWNGTSFVYGSCPYTGGAYYQLDNSSTTNPALDACGKQITSCAARFGSQPLPTYAFPGVAIAPPS